MKFAILLNVKRIVQTIWNAWDSILQQIVKLIVVVCTQKTLQQEEILEMTEENIVNERRVK